MGQRENRRKKEIIVETTKQEPEIDENKITRKN